MNGDVMQRLGAVSREVRNLEYEGRAAVAVVATRTYATDIDDVWDALTNAERIPRWFSPVTGDLRLGGRYQVQGNASGQITACEPPRSFALTWEYGGKVSWLRVSLSTVEAGTLLELEHINPLPDDHWDKFGAGATGVGWDLALLGLGEYLESGASKAAENATAWMASEEGKRFMRASSDDWCRAAIAAGLDEATARAAAARTTAAYTGEGGEPAGH